jgi:hypothetical protein
MSAVQDSQLCALARAVPSAFWLRPDWSGGSNMRDPGVQPFWTRPPGPLPSVLLRQQREDEAKASKPLAYGKAAPDAGELVGSIRDIWGLLMFHLPKDRRRYVMEAKAEWPPHDPDNLVIRWRELESSRPGAPVHHYSLTITPVDLLYLRQNHGLNIEGLR